MFETQTPGEPGEFAEKTKVKKSGTWCAFKKGGLAAGLARSKAAAMWRKRSSGKLSCGARTAATTESLLKCTGEEEVR